MAHSSELPDPGLQGAHPNPRSYRGVYGVPTATLTSSPEHQAPAAVFHTESSPVPVNIWAVRKPYRKTHLLSKYRAVRGKANTAGNWRRLNIYFQTGSAVTHRAQVSLRASATPGKGTLAPPSVMADRP